MSPISGFVTNFVTNPPFFVTNRVTNQPIFVTNRVTNRVTNYSKALMHMANHFIGKVRVTQSLVGANSWMIHLTRIEVLLPFPNLMILCVF